MSKRPGEGQVFLFARQRVLTLAILGTRRQYRRELELKMDLEKAEVESKVHPSNMTMTFDELHTGKVARSFRLSEEDSCGVSS